MLIRELLYLLYLLVLLSFADKDIIFEQNDNGKGDGWICPFLPDSWLFLLTNSVFSDNNKKIDKITLDYMFVFMVDEEKGNILAQEIPQITIDPSQKYAVFLNSDGSETNRYIKITYIGTDMNSLQINVSDGVLFENKKSCRPFHIYRIEELVDFPAIHCIFLYKNKNDLKSFLHFNVLNTYIIDIKKLIKQKNICLVRKKQ